LSGKILQVSVGMPADICFNGKNVTTGIFKRPVDGNVSVNLLHLDGDGQADLKVHGGRDKAIYVYPACHYQAWKKELGIESLQAAQFGENLTVAGMSDKTVIVGDRYRVGSAQVMVTQPRLPCFKLGIRMDDKSFPSRFLASGRLGFYLRVEQTGMLETGDTFELLDRPEHGISVHNLWSVVFDAPHRDENTTRGLAELEHLDAGWRRRIRLIMRKNYS
jgi:MOSC domain-containing protein YiiM